MGGTTSTQAGEIDNDSKVTENQNFGLLNFSNESQSLTGGINLLEIITFIIVCLATFYFLKIFCERRRKRRLAEMGQHLQGINLQELPGQPAAPVVHAARVPIMSLQPPLYPGNQLNSAQMDSAGKYDI